MSGSGSGYLDYATAAPLHPAAESALRESLADGWADPARTYAAGRRARLLLDEARESIAEALAVHPSEVAFTANGTQAVHLALLGGLEARRRVGRHLVTSAVEHSSVLQAARRHDRRGGSSVAVAVDATGRVEAAAFAAACRAGGDTATAVASLQSANHEVGCLQPVREVAAELAGSGIVLHCDAAQSVGVVPLDLGALGADVLTASARKWGGPPGVGLLVVRSGTRWRSPAPEDEHEGGRVPGAVGLPAVVAAAAALRARRDEVQAEAARLAALTGRLRDRVPQLVPGVEVLGPAHAALRQPHLVTFSFLYVEGEALLEELDREGLAASSGSSCSASSLEPSHVLVAMGALTHGNLRLSLGRDSAPGDVEHLLDVLPRAVGTVRQRLGAPPL